MFAGGKYVWASDHSKTNKVEEYLPVSFSVLSGFAYTVPDEEKEMKKQIIAGTLKNQVPAEVRALNNQKISIQGFILPSYMNENKLKSFVMMPNQMGCCFGMSPPFNGWIYVTMPGDGSVDWAQDAVVTVTGTFHVGETIDADGGMSLYRMDGEKIKIIKRGFMDRLLNG